MAISDMLNRRVRARPDDDEDVYSEGSDVSDAGVQHEGSEDEESDEDLQSQDVCINLILLVTFHLLNICPISE